MSFYAYQNNSINKTLESFNNNVIGNLHYLKVAQAETFTKAVVIGAGGVGARLVRDLVKVMPGHLDGTTIFVIDDDVVSANNITRQAFAPQDVGKPKALVLAQRYNETNRNKNIRVEAVIGKVEQVFANPDSDFSRMVMNGNYTHTVFFGCVDNISTRHFLLDFFRNQWKNPEEHYQRLNRKMAYIDCGSDRTSGQVVIAFAQMTGYTSIMDTAPVILEGWRAVPNVFNRDSDLAKKLERENQGGCAVTVDSQTAVSNQHVALAALQLYTGFKRGTHLLTTLGYRLNSAAMQAEPIPFRFTATWGWNSVGTPAPYITAVPASVPDEDIKDSFYRVGPDGAYDLTFRTTEERDFAQTEVPCGNFPTYTGEPKRFEKDYVWDWTYWRWIDNDTNKPRPSYSAEEVRA